MDLSVDGTETSDGSGWDGLAGDLALADWRRRIAGLYAEVRRLAVTDPVAAVERWRTVREQLYRQHPQSPVPESERPAFRALHFPYDAALRFELEVRPADRQAAPTVSAPIPMSSGSPLSFRRIGWLDVPFPTGLRRLALYWVEGYADGLFLPFRDATNSAETYEAGRYVLDAAKSADLGGDLERSTLVLDFNFAYHPSCAFDPRWSCPLAPPENRLDMAIRAGERLA
jgi:uncharacterized protein (DUF1684 family)